MNIISIVISVFHVIKILYCNIRNKNNMRNLNDKEHIFSVSKANLTVSNSFLSNNETEWILYVI